MRPLFNFWQIFDSVDLVGDENVYAQTLDG
jgi:hypothetical protein